MTEDAINGPWLWAYLGGHDGIRPAMVSDGNDDTVCTVVSGPRQAANLRAIAAVPEMVSLLIEMSAAIHGGQLLACKYKAGRLLDQIGGLDTDDEDAATDNVPEDDDE